MTTTQCKDNALQIVECLKKYDEDHEKLYEARGVEMAELLCRTFKESIKLYSCTEESQIAGTDPRVDAVVEVGGKKYALEAKLSLTSGAALGRKVFKQAQKTLEKLQIATAPLILLVPKEHLEEAKKQLANYIIRVLRNHGIRVGQDDVIFSFQLDPPLLSTRLKKRHKEFLKLKNQYKIESVMLLLI